MRTKFDIYVLLEPVTVTEDENHLLVEDCQVLAPDFFNEKIIKLKGIKSKERNNLGKIVSGRSITETAVAEQVKQHAENQRKKKPKDSILGSSKQTSTQDDTCNYKKKRQKVKENQSQKPGTSNIYIDSDLTDPETDDDEIPEEEKCCVSSLLHSKLGLD